MCTYKLFAFELICFTTRYRQQLSEPLMLNISFTDNRTAPPHSSTCPLSFCLYPRTCLTRTFIYPSLQLCLTIERPWGALQQTNQHTNNLIMQILSQKTLCFVWLGYRIFLKASQMILLLV